MTRPATRERKERFIKSFEGAAVRDAAMLVDRRLSRHGLSWLTDEQLDEITADLVSDARFSQTLRIRNRNALRRAS